MEVDIQPIVDAVMGLKVAIVIVIAIVALLMSIFGVAIITILQQK